MSSNDDRLDPSRNRSRDLLKHDRLAEDSPVQDITNRSIRRPPHLFQVELDDSIFVRGDRCAFNADVIFEDSLCAVDGDLIFGSITMFESEIKVLDVEFEIGKNELLNECE